MSLDEFLEQTKGKRIYNSSPDIVSGNFECEKIEQDEVFYYKDILYFFSELPKYYTYQKLGVTLTN
jgi:hypothetical protein